MRRKIALGTVIALLILVVAGHASAGPSSPETGSVHSDGIWWESLAHESKLVAVKVMIDAYESGYASGALDILSANAHNIADNKKAFESLSSAEERLGFTRTEKTYVDELDDFYANYPDLMDKVLVSDLMDCMADHPKQSCDQYADFRRHPPTLPPHL